MMKAILLCTTAAFLAGCAVPAKPLCDREAQTWDKFQTIEDECVVIENVAVVTPGGGDNNGPKTPGPKDPGPKDPPPKDPDPETPKTEDKPKSDNSDANGKGGNKHDRDDKDKPSQEIAEDKKADRTSKIKLVNAGGKSAR